MCIHERGNVAWEEMAYDAMRGITTDHPGGHYLRLHEDEFDVTGPSGYDHHAFIFPPAACTIAQLMKVLGALNHLWGKIVMRNTLLALDFLHTIVHCVHTDVKTNNILLKLKSRKVVEELVASFEDDPPKSKGSRKKGTLIYRSRHFRALGREGFDVPILSDLGEARVLGDEADHNPLPMGPLAIRAPENVLDMRWGYPVDVWQAGCMFYEILTNKPLFTAPAEADEWSTTFHLAQMVALLGPPPADFVSRSESCKTYFNDDGSWKGYEGVAVPDATLEQKFAEVEIEENEGVDRAVLVDFFRGMLTWKPEERKTAREMGEHSFVSFE